MKRTYLVGIAALVTVLLLVSNAYFSSTGDFKCTNTEDAIIKQDAKIVDPTRPADQDKKDGNLLKYCAVHTKVCGPAGTEQTPRVLEICQAYR